MKSKDRTPTNVTGHRWIVWKRVDIADIGDEGSIYLTRFILLLTPFFGIYLHKINRPDADRNLHDHPWSFLAIILKGGYTEQVSLGGGANPTWGTRTRTWGRFSWHRVMRGTYHRIATLHRTPTWSLCLIGPRRGTWGFYDPVHGWMQYEEYFDEYYPGWREADTHKEGAIYETNQPARMDAVLDRRHEFGFLRPIGPLSDEDQQKIKDLLDSKEKST